MYVGTLYLLSSSCVFSIVTAHTTSLAKCQNDEDCSLNGICSNGTCSCDPQWRGADCGVLNLMPAKKGTGFQREGFNQWGGNPFWKDNKWHVFAVEMTNGCPIGDYLTNSQIVHATADVPEGPYTFQGVFIPPFAHAPHVAFAPDGTLLVVYEGKNDTIPPEEQKQCSSELPPNFTQERRLQHTHPECTGIMVASSASGSIEGPWKHDMLYWAWTDPDKPWDADIGNNNPSLWVTNNGTTFIAFRTCSGPEHTGIIAAEHWSGIYRDPLNHSIFPRNQNEDPFMWQDRGGNFHMLLHDQSREHWRVGGHAFSRDGISWIWSSTTAYTTTVPWTDNSSTTLSRRERPSLVLSDAPGAPRSVPSHLFTSAQVGHHQWLLAQPIHQGSDLGRGATFV